METFLYKNLNYAMRISDKNKFISFKPICFALKFSIEAQKYRNDVVIRDGTKSLYRGLKLS
jgi:hypothetical protein